MVSIDTIREKVSSNPQWATRAIIVLYRRQTADEQNSETTVHKNGVGFNGTDAEILSSFAKWVLGGRSLTQKQLAIAYRKLPKYARQLMDEAQIREQELARLQTRVGTPEFKAQVTEDRDDLYSTKLPLFGYAAVTNEARIAGVEDAA